MDVREELRRLEEELAEAEHRHYQKWRTRIEESETARREMEANMTTATDDDVKESYRVILGGLNKDAEALAAEMEPDEEKLQKKQADFGWLRDRLERALHPAEVSRKGQNKTFAYGLVILAAMCALTAITGTLLAGVVEADRAWFATGLGIIPLLLVLGFRKLEPGWVGLPLLFGKRVESWVYDEGWQPTIPFVIDFDQVDLREDVQILKFEDLQVFTKDLVRIVIYASVYFRVTNPHRFRSVTSTAVREGLNDIMDQALRLLAKKESLDKVLGGDFLRKVSIEILAQSVSRAEEWGVAITRVPIPEIQPEDKDVVSDLAQARREKAQRMGQLVEGRTTHQIGETIDPEHKMSQGERIRKSQLITGKSSETVTRTETGQDSRTLETYERIASLLSDGIERGLVAVADRMKGVNHGNT